MQRNYYAIVAARNNSRRTLAAMKSGCPMAIAARRTEWVNLRQYSSVRCGARDVGQRCNGSVAYRGLSV